MIRGHGFSQVFIRVGFTASRWTRVPKKVSSLVRRKARVRVKSLEKTLQVPRYSPPGPGLSV